MSRSAIIIGAGYGGMALANILGKAGYHVDVYEKNAELGGRISSISQDGYVFDLGPSWYLMPEVFEQYYELFGQSAAERLDLIRLTPGYKVFFDHHDPLTIQGDVDKDAATFEAIEPGAGEKLHRYVARSSNIYHLSVNYFLYSNFEHIRQLLRRHHGAVDQDLVALRRQGHAVGELDVGDISRRAGNHLFDFPIGSPRKDLPQHFPQRTNIIA